MSRSVLRTGHVGGTGHADPAFTGQNITKIFVFYIGQRRERERGRREESRERERRNGEKSRAAEERTCKNKRGDKNGEREKKEQREREKRIEKVESGKK